MALASGSIFNIQASATTGNTGGAGFNTANANFPTDLTTDTNTGNTASPVVSSATYNFVAGDVGAWVYIKSGTNWTPGFYSIASVASNKATLSAGVGAAWQLNSATGMYQLNTVAGCATVGTPTSGTYGVNYAALDTANSTVTNLASAGGVTTVTSISNPWTPVSVGNFLHITTTGTGAHFVTGWYEIVSETLVSSVVLDRVPDDGSAGVAGTAQTGGAGRLNGLEDAFYEMIPSASLVYVKNGSYTFSATVSVASTNSTAALPSFTIGYNSIPSDTCTGSNRPIFAMGTNAITWGQYQMMMNIQMTGTAASLNSGGTGYYAENCSFKNSSTTANRTALNMGAATDGVFNCEMVSQNGNGASTSATRQKMVGCYIHNSDVGYTGSSTGNNLFLNLFEGCITTACNLNGTGENFIVSNTFYGREGKIGNGLYYNNTGSVNNRTYDNIFYGLTTGTNVLTNQQNSSTGGYNDYFNNTTDTTNYNKAPTDIAVNPSFAGATQITGTTGSGSGSTITDTNADFSTVEDNVDYVYQASGTGATVAMFLITSHTATTLVCNNTVGTNATADRVYYVWTGHNFMPTGNV